MFEIDLNNGRFREINLNLPVFCCKCGKEIIRGENCNTVNLVIDVCCGYAFCKDCKKKLMDFCGNKISKYEKKLVNEFLQDENEENKLFELWVDKFREEYAYIYNLSDRIKKNELRYSRKRYGNSQQVLEMIKDKYKNGITEDILNEFYNKLKG